MGWWLPCMTATRAVAQASVQVVNILKEAMHRILSSLDLVASASGIQAPKKLRLRIVILRAAATGPIADPSEVYPALLAAQEIFATQAHVQIIPAGGHFVHTLAEVAPPAALAVHCGFAAWQEDLGAAGAYFGSQLARTLSGIVFGYAVPITVFIVQDLHGKLGCSLGPLVDYVTLSRAGLRRPRTLAHELAHACGLWHVQDATNLLDPHLAGGTLRWWQTAIVRTSRHVTYG